MTSRKAVIWVAISVFLCSALALYAAERACVKVRPVVATESVEVDADDPAIWVNSRNPAQSLILATDKGGSLYVFGLDGKIRQRITGLRGPNNVDVEYGFVLQGRRVDIAVVTEADARRLRVYEISAEDGKLRDVSGDNLGVFRTGGQGAKPMGIGIYRRPRDRAIFAIVSRSKGPKQNYMGQYRLSDDGTGRVKAEEVRKFGRFSGKGTIEAVAVDDEAGYVYYGDEEAGIRKYFADPDKPGADKELAFFGEADFLKDREGIAVYCLDGLAGYIICSDQTLDSRYLIYQRKGTDRDPHDHSELLKVVCGGAEYTDGLDATSKSLGPRFPNGILVVMNNRERNFLVYDWRHIAQTGTPVLGTRGNK